MKSSKNLAELFDAGVMGITNKVVMAYNSVFGGDKYDCAEAAAMVAPGFSMVYQMNQKNINYPLTVLSLGASAGAFCLVNAIKHISRKMEGRDSLNQNLESARTCAQIGGYIALAGSVIALDMMVFKGIPAYAEYNVASFAALGLAGLAPSLPHTPRRKNIVSRVKDHLVEKIKSYQVQPQPSLA